MPSAVSGRQCPAESPTKNTPSSVAAPQLVGDPVALEARPRPGRARAASATVGSLTRSRGSNEPHADAHLARRREAPAVAGADVGGVEPQLELAARARAGGPRARARAAPAEAGSRVAAREHAPPAERVDDQRRAQLAAVGCDRVRAPGADPRRPSRSRTRVDGEPSRSSRAQRAVVEGRERERQRPAHAVRRGRARRRSGKVCRIESRRPSRSSHSVGAAQADVCALADLVAVDHQHARAGPLELARERQSGEARAADRARRSRARSGVRSAPRAVARVGIARR